MGRDTGNSEATKLGSGQGKPLHTYGSGKYEEGRDIKYGSVMTNTGQAIKKPSVRTDLFERVYHGC